MAAIRAQRRSGGPRAVLVGTAALALGIALLALTPGADRLPPGGRLVPVFIVVVGWGFTGIGAFAWLRRPDNRMGPLMITFGIAVLLSGLVIADAALPYLISGLADAFALPLFVHLLLAFPSGRLEGRTPRLVVCASYAVAIVPQLLAVLIGDPAGDPGCSDCPRNPVLVAAHDGLAEAALAVKSAAGLALALAAVVLALRRGRASSPVLRRAFAPLAVAGAVLLGLVVVSVSAQALDVRADLQKAAQLVFIAGFVGLPVAFLVGLMRSRFFRTAALSRLLERLAVDRADGIGTALAAALGDPSLTVAYWLGEQAGYVDRDGRPVILPPAGDHAVATEIAHHGNRIGALVHDVTLCDDPELLRAVAGATALALENDRLEVELRARLEALRASRARIVVVGDDERRRLGRDLHDGAQQRLVSILLDLQLARNRWEDQPELARARVDSALENARAAVDELRELAAGIHPAILTQRGLDAALESLATRSAVPVELDVELSGRLPAAIETAAYFVVAEGLTNVVKYAQATHVAVRVRHAEGAALVELRDDGIGGADAARGTGLRGLADRVGAIDGTLELVSPDGAGTLLRVRFPLVRRAGT